MTLTCIHLTMIEIWRSQRFCVDSFANMEYKVLKDVDVVLIKIPQFISWRSSASEQKRSTSLQTKSFHQTCMQTLANFRLLAKFEGKSDYQVWKLKHGQRKLEHWSVNVSIKCFKTDVFIGKYTSTDPQILAPADRTVIPDGLSFSKSYRHWWYLGRTSEEIDESSLPDICYDKWRWLYERTTIVESDDLLNVAKYDGKLMNNKCDWHQVSANLETRGKELRAKEGMWGQVLIDQRWEEWCRQTGKSISVVRVMYDVSYARSCEHKMCLANSVFKICVLLYLLRCPAGESLMFFFFF